MHYIGSQILSGVIALCLLTTHADIISESQAATLTLGTRSAWKGFLQGLYNQNDVSVSPQCLDNDFGKKLANLVNSIAADPNTWINYMITDGMFMVANLGDCNFNHPIYDFYSYCLVHDKCRMETLVQNVKPQVFSTLEILSDMLSIVTTQKFPPDDEQTLATQCFQTG